MSEEIETCEAVARRIYSFICDKKRDMGLLMIAKVVLAEREKYQDIGFDEGWKSCMVVVKEAVEEKDAYAAQIILSALKKLEQPDEN